MTQYPKDEFDDTSVQVPVGLHRGSRTVGSRLLPYIITLVVAVIVALAVWLWVSGTAASLFGNNADTASTSSSQTTDQPVDQPSKTGDPAGDSDANTDDTPDVDTDGTDTDTTDTQTPATPPVNHSAQVIVYNATGKTGYAATQAKILTDAGYTQVTADNKNSGLPLENTIYYKTPEDLTTAQDVGKLLGITAINQLSADSAPVEIVLVK
jgi:cytoskeletal protein RodZ